MAARIRGQLGHRNLTKHDLAVMLGENDVWIGRRIAAGRRRVALDLNDLQRIANVLEIDIAELLPNPGPGWPEHARAQPAPVAAESEPLRQYAGRRPMVVR